MSGSMDYVEEQERQAQRDADTARWSDQPAPVETEPSAAKIEADRKHAEYMATEDYFLRIPREDR